MRNTYPRVISISPNTIRSKSRKSTVMIVTYYMLFVVVLIGLTYFIQSYLSTNTVAGILHGSSISTSSTRNSSYRHRPALAYDTVDRSLTHFNVSLPTSSEYIRLSAKSTPKSSLYSSSHHIMEFSGPEVRSLLSNITNHYPTIIVYYASWCGHCQHFVKVYQQIASDVLIGMKIPIILGALDCMNYQSDCYEAGVRAYPSAKAYNIISDKESLKHPGATVDARQMRLYVTRHKAAIQAIYTKEIQAISSPTSSYPDEHSLKILPNKLFTSSSDTSLSSTVNDPMLPVVKLASHSHAAWNATPELRLHDSLMSFKYMLIVEARRELTSRKLATLTRVLQMITHLPRPPSQSQDVEMLWMSMDSLYQWITSHTQTQIITEYASTSATFFNISTDDDVQYVWKVCGVQASLTESYDASDQVRRGYTCGLWMLFHYMTVAGSHDIKSSSSKPSSLSSTNEIMTTIKSLVEEFFGCTGCRHHFLKAYRDCLYDRCSHQLTKSSTNYDALQLWLWRFHNAVSIRVHQQTKRQGVDNEQVEHVLWPPSSQCESCWLKQPVHKKPYTFSSLRLSIGYDQDAKTSIPRHVVNGEAALYNSTAIISQLQHEYWN